MMGDRLYGDDPALLGGWADFMGIPIVFLGQNKGSSIQERLDSNSGMMHPEGYRKAHRLALMAEKFQAPLITFIDTPGAYPGIEAEQRGQSIAIAENLKLFSTLKTPIINIIIGEGCSGGALGIGVGDRLWMMQYSYFSVISPEGCASILFKSLDQTKHAAKMMQLTAHELLSKGLIDKIISEPLGGAHTDPQEAINILRLALEEELSLLNCEPKDKLVSDRYQKIMKTGI
jgi:acetyl-CoA carboxylase carboxyl transferase subunit alpha